jgi:hypothetical protein
MQPSEVILSDSTRLARRVVCAVVIPLCLAAVSLAIATIGAASLEFKHAHWVEVVRYPAALTEFFRSSYLWGWCLPVGLCAWALFLVGGASRRLSSVLVFVGVGFLLMLFWTLLTLLAFYLANQSFVHGT